MRRTVFALVAVLFAASLSAQNLEIHTLNVEWGGSVLVVGPDGTTVLLEAGETGMGTAYVAPYLNSVGIAPGDGLDYTIIGHQHCDHLGGMDEVVAAGYDVHVGQLLQRLAARPPAASPAGTPPRRERPPAARPRCLWARSSTSEAVRR